MIKAKTCFVAEGVIFERDSGQVSAFNLVESMRGESYPLAVYKMAFLSLWQRESSDPRHYRGEFSITQGELLIARQTIDIDFLDHLRHRIRVAITGFIVPLPGAVVFRLAIEGHGSAEYTFEAEPPAQVTGAAPG
jgi:hypothetical protein